MVCCKVHGLPGGGAKFYLQYSWRCWWCTAAVRSVFLAASASWVLACTSPSAPAKRACMRYWGLVGREGLFDADGLLDDGKPWRVVVEGEGLLGYGGMPRMNVPCGGMRGRLLLLGVWVGSVQGGEGVRTAKMR